MTAARSLGPAARSDGPTARWANRAAPGPVLMPIVATVAGWVSWAVLAIAGVGEADAGHGSHVAEMIVMTLAMMGLLALPLADAVHRRAPWTIAGRAVGLAVTVFLGLWAATAVALHGLTDLAVHALGPTVLWLAIGGLVVVDAPSRARARRLDECGVSRPLLPSAVQAHAGLFGVDVFRRCVLTCWAPMALAVIEPIVVVPVTVILAVERLASPRPRSLVTAAYAVVVVAPLLAGRIALA